MDENENENYNNLNEICKIDLDSKGILKTIRFMNENSCKTITTCDEGYYKCYNQNYCITIELICNGISECFYHDDELNCGKKFFLQKIEKE